MIGSDKILPDSGKRLEKRSGRQQFQRKLRLTGKSDFSRVFERPERSADRFFTVLARPNGLAYARLGMAISKKSVKLAVARNRLKRLIRENFRCSQERLPGIDIVVISRSHADQQDNITISATLQKHWSRLVEQCAKA